MSLRTPRFFDGSGLIVAPHMDDEVLACGGTIASLAAKNAWHVIYATDGRESPKQPTHWRDKKLPDLAQIRQAEAREAMNCLGLPQTNLHFLNLPDGRLHRHKAELREAFSAFIIKLQPDHILVPFRYDRHPDHLTINHVLTEIVHDGEYAGQLTEYFVYYRWRLLPLGDVRRYIRPELLQTVETSAAAAQKRVALECFRSQTTCFFPWQARSILSAQLLAEVSLAPELFLPYDRTLPGPAVFCRATAWIPIVHRLEPVLKRCKDWLVSSIREGSGRARNRIQSERSCK